MGKVVEKFAVQLCFVIHFISSWPETSSDLLLLFQKRYKRIKESFAKITLRQRHEVKRTTNWSSVSDSEKNENNAAFRSMKIKLIWFSWEVDWSRNYRTKQGSVGPMWQEQPKSPRRIRLMLPAHVLSWAFNQVVSPINKDGHGAKHAQILSLLGPISCWWKVRVEMKSKWKEILRLCCWG